MINKLSPFKGLDIRIPTIIPRKGRGLSIMGLGYAVAAGVEGVWSPELQALFEALCFERGHEYSSTPAPRNCYRCYLKSPGTGQHVSSDRSRAAGLSQLLSGFRV